MPPHSHSHYSDSYSLQLLFHPYDLSRLAVLYCFLFQRNSVQTHKNQSQFKNGDGAFQEVRSKASLKDNVQWGYRLSGKLNKIVFELIMGNTECCDEPRDDAYPSQIVAPIQTHPPKEEVPNEPSHEHNHEPHQEEHQQPSAHHEPEEPVQLPAHPSGIHIEVVMEEAVEIPVLAPRIQERVKAESYFAEHFEGELQSRRYGQEVYQGQLDEHGKFPHGWGRMYKADGAYYVGHFQNGKADGQGAYLTPDGLVYHGHFHNNCASGQGRYETTGFTYQGHFLKNLFHGSGKETAAEYEYEGEYYEGNKTHGTFKWKDAHGKDYTYTGHFNFNNQFHGQGFLVEPNGTYSGSFIDGLKDGKGVYKFNTGLRYEGEYSRGAKKGKGTIFNFNGSISYEGEFDRDMPHGKGYIYDASGVRHEALWELGIDTSFL